MSIIEYLQQGGKAGEQKAGEMLQVLEALGIPMDVATEKLNSLDEETLNVVITALNDIVEKRNSGQDMSSAQESLNILQKVFMQSEKWGGKLEQLVNRFAKGGKAIDCGCGGKKLKCGGKTKKAENGTTLLDRANNLDNLGLSRSAQIARDFNKAYGTTEPVSSQPAQTTAAPVTPQTSVINPGRPQDLSAIYDPSNVSLSRRQAIESAQGRGLWTRRNAMDAFRAEAMQQFPMLNRYRINQTARNRYRTWKAAGNQTYGQLTRDAYNYALQLGLTGDKATQYARQQAAWGMHGNDLYSTPIVNSATPAPSDISVDTTAATVADPFEKWRNATRQNVQNTIASYNTTPAETTGPAETADPFAGKTDEQLAQEVLRGVYGNGSARRQALGNRYAGVQAIISNTSGNAGTQSRIPNGTERTRPDGTIEGRDENGNYYTRQTVEPVASNQPEGTTADQTTEQRNGNVNNGFAPYVGRYMVGMLAGPVGMWQTARNLYRAYNSYTTPSAKQGGTIKQQGGTMLTKKEAKNLAIQNKGFNNSQFNIAYANAKDSLRNNSGLRGRELRAAARNMVSGYEPVEESNPYDTTIKYGDIIPSQRIEAIPVDRVQVKPLGIVAPTIDDNARYSALADAVIAGKFGNGANRADSLGTDYIPVQNIVNDRLRGRTPVTPNGSESESPFKEAVKNAVESGLGTVRYSKPQTLFERAFSVRTPLRDRGGMLDTKKDGGEKRKEIEYRIQNNRPNRELITNPETLRYNKIWSDIAAGNAIPPEENDYDTAIKKREKRMK